MLFLKDTQMNLSKAIILLILILTTSTCNMKFFYKEPVLKLTTIPTNLDKKRIALVGFYDFRTEQVGLGKIRRYVTSIDYDTRILGTLSQIATPVEDLKEASIEIPSQENIALFRKDYLAITGNIGKGVLQSILTVDKDGKYYFKSRDVDYYILGYFGPRVSINKRNVAFLGLPQKLNFLISMASIFTIPTWHDYYTDNRFFVYDRKLTLVFDSTKTKYTNGILAWWVTPNDEEASGKRDGEDFGSQQLTKYARFKIYEPDLEEFTVSFLEWKKKNQK